LGFFQGGKATRRIVDHPALSSAEVKERDIALFLLWALMACFKANFTFYNNYHPLRLQFKTMKRSRAHEHKTMTMMSGVYTYMRPLYLVMHIHKTIHSSE
jgi:hypothetical protein